MSSGSVWAPVAVLSLAAIALAPSSASSAQDPLARYRDKARLIVAIAPDSKDARLIRQRDAYRAMGAGAQERDLVLIEAVGDSAEALALRSRFGVGGKGFRAILVGKDGGEKLGSDEPLAADDLYPLIDAMPMRQQEMRQRS